MKTKPLLFAALALSIPAHAEVLWRGSFGEPGTQTFANGVFSVNETVAGFTRTPFVSGTYTTASDMASANFWTVLRSDFSTMCDGAP
jgi:hypothetical protein